MAIVDHRKKRLLGEFTGNETKNTLKDLQARMRDKLRENDICVDRENDICVVRLS